MMCKYWSRCVYAVSVDDIFGCLTCLSGMIDVSFQSSLRVVDSPLHPKTGKIQLDNNIQTSVTAVT